MASVSVARHREVPTTLKITEHVANDVVRVVSDTARAIEAVGSYCPGQGH